MNGRILRLCVLGVVLIGISACGMTKPHSRYVLQSYNPLKNLDAVQPAAGQINANILNAAPKKSCSFSSFHRKNTIGYELDDRRQIGFSVKPKLDIFDPSDAEVEVGLRFTMALGGSANKRPKCTYGSGYYGLVPYAMNDKIDLAETMDAENIKSFVQEKLEAREQRRKERDAKSQLRL